MINELIGIRLWPYNEGNIVVDLAVFVEAAKMLFPIPSSSVIWSWSYCSEYLLRT